MRTDYVRPRCKSPRRRSCSPSWAAPPRRPPRCRSRRLGAGAPTRPIFAPIRWRGSSARGLRGPPAARRQPPAVRFDGFVTNVGQRPLEISGNPQVPGNAGPTGVKQYTCLGETRAAATSRRSRSAPRRSSSRPGQPQPLPPEARDASTRSGTLSKTARSRRVRRSASASTTSRPRRARAGPRRRTYYNDAVTELLRFGQSRGDLPAHGRRPGRRDVYSKALAFQWIDVSATAPGTYWWRAWPTRTTPSGRRRRATTAAAARPTRAPSPAAGHGARLGRQARHRPAEPTARRRSASRRRPSDRRATRRASRSSPRRPTAR